MCQLHIICSVNDSCGVIYGQLLPASILKMMNNNILTTETPFDSSRGVEDVEYFQRDIITGLLFCCRYCTARQCSPLRRKFLECSINSPAVSLLIKHLVIGQRLKTPNFSAFHWSPHACLVSIGQHFVTRRVVHLPKRTETSLITKSDQSGPNYHLLQLCTARTAWSDSDQAARAVHSCNSWFLQLSFQGQTQIYFKEYTSFIELVHE